MTPHSSTLALKIPWTEKPGRLQSMGSLRVGHDWATSLSLFTFMCWRRKWQPTPVFLPGESQGRGSLVRCPLWGRTESDMTDRLSSSSSSGLLIERLAVDFKRGRWLCKEGDQVSETTWVKVWMKMCMSFQGPWGSKMRKTVPLQCTQKWTIIIPRVFFFLKNFLFCVGVETINNVEVILGEQQRDLAIQIQVSILPQAPSPPGSHITLDRVPCALQ